MVIVIGAPVSCHDELLSLVIARSEATRQSEATAAHSLDCFAALAMTEKATPRLLLCARNDMKKPPGHGGPSDLLTISGFFQRTNALIQRRVAGK